jgi:hypothetical protein
MNAYKVREVAMGGAVRLAIGKLAEVAEGGAGFVWVTVGADVAVLWACNLDIAVSDW